jgi:hypothetical protein
MRHLIALSLLSVGWTAAATSTQSSEPGSNASAPTAAVGDLIVGEPIRHRNLTVFPVSSRVPCDVDQYLTLGEGLQAGTVEVSELGADESAAPARPRASRPQARPARPRAAAEDPFAEPIQVPPEPRRQPAPTALQVGQSAADVNRLVVVNRSQKPLYLMPGEIIYGGQQDRVMGEEALIPADGKPVIVKVYCVEHGRWAYRSPGETEADVARLSNPSGPRLSPQQLRQKAAAARSGKFVAPAGNLHKQGRLAVQDSENQGEVWAKVGEANAATGATSRSGAFTANYTNPRVLQQIQGYLDQLQTPVSNGPQVVGAIAAIDGKVEAVDVFQSTPLFRKLWPKLLQSHALDAAKTAGRSKSEKVCGLEDAQAFLHSVLEANVEKQSSAPGGLQVTKRESPRVVSFSAAPADAASGPGLGGFGGPHLSGFSK